MCVNPLDATSIQPFTPVIYTMPSRPSAGAIAIYRQCVDWQAFEQAPQSDDWKKLRNAICTDSSRKHQPRADVYAYKREKALRHANNSPAGNDIQIVDASLSAAATGGIERSSSNHLVAVATDVNVVPRMDIESRLTRLEHLLRKWNNKPKAEARGIVVRNHGFVVAGVTCTASHVEWEEERRSCGVVDCLLLWANQSWSYKDMDDERKQDDPSHQVRIWQRMHLNNSTDVLLVVVDKQHAGNCQQHQYRYLRHPHRSLPDTSEVERPVVYIDLEQHAYLLTGQDLVNKLYPTLASDGQHQDWMVLDLAVEPKRRRTSSKRNSADALSGEKKRRSATDDDTVVRMDNRTDDESSSSNNSKLRLHVHGEALIAQLGLARTSVLPDGRPALIAVLVALGQFDGGDESAGASNPAVVVMIEQSCQQLARRLELWTERMWVKHVPGGLRQHHGGLVVPIRSSSASTSRARTTHISTC